jgi:acetyl esterase/lipase
MNRCCCWWWCWPAAAALLLAAESVVYTHSGGESLTLEQAPAGQGPHPAVLLLGIPELAPAAASAGYAAFTLTHRTGYPGSLEDVQRAVRYVRFHARRWKVDPKRVALIGYSPEGALASLAGLAAAAAAAPPPTRDPADRADAALQAVVAIAAPSDFRQAGLDHTEPEAWSPVLHIRGPDAPPFLLIHGDADHQVPLTQSTHLQNALQAAGVKCNLIIVSGGGHRPGEWRRDARDWMGEMFGWLGQVLRRR